MRLIQNKQHMAKESLKPSTESEKQGPSAQSFSQGKRYCNQQLFNLLHNERDQHEPGGQLT